MPSCILPDVSSLIRRVRHGSARVSSGSVLCRYSAGDCMSNISHGWFSSDIEIYYNGKYKSRKPESPAVVFPNRTSRQAEPSRWCAAPNRSRYDTEFAEESLRIILPLKTLQCQNLTFPEAQTSMDICTYDQHTGPIFRAKWRSQHYHAQPHGY